MLDDTFVGEIVMVGFDFAPTGFAECNGQLLPLIQNTALFSLLGTYYGGNGTSTFALPDLQGMVAIGVGLGPGLTERFQGESSGAETVTLTINEMPSHTHVIKTRPLALPIGATNNTYNPVGNYLGETSGTNMYSAVAGSGKLASVKSSLQATLLNSPNSPVNNMQPYTTIMFLIAVAGIFPARH